MAKVSTVKANRIADETNGWSKERYGKAEWRTAARLMASRGFSERQIAVVLDSKWMRWAADAANRQATGAKGRDLIEWIEKHLGGRFYKQLADLVFEVTGEHESTDEISTTVFMQTPTGADLAGACEGEDIAALIDFAIEIAKSGTPIQRTAAAAIVTRIQERAK